MLKLAIVALAATLTTAAAAQAADVTFAFHRSELSSDIGRSALHDRMLASVKEFCMVESRRSLKAFRKEGKCVADLSGQLVERIADPSLSALHAAAL